MTTVYIGNTYEWTASGAKSYYYAGNVRIAMRTGNNPGTINYLLSDHLGSTALTTDSNGNRQAELRYHPYGKNRYTYGTTPTTFRYTGQRQQTNANELYFYQSRWYDPLVGRFLSADTIVPDPKNPQALNRYAYGSGNPVKYTDPSGHAPEWLDNVWSYASGASAQYLEDITLGAWSALVVKVDLDLVDSEAYQQGRETGRSVSTAQAEFEVATGIGAAIAGAAAAPITLGGGTLCAVGTAGLCAIPAGLALGAEGAMVVGGAATALHGGGVLLYAKGNPTGGAEVQRSMIGLRNTISSC